MGNLHLVLNFPNLSLTVDGRKTDTITEHKSVCENNTRLIWGQSSKRKSSGVAEKNRNRIQNKSDEAVESLKRILRKSIIENHFNIK